MNLDLILSERLAILGGTGSGKSYTARGLSERVILSGRRLGVIDPTGVWWGLRLAPAGKKPSGLDVVIFGGDRADVVITENAGRIVAQAVAASIQSWILDTSALKTKAAERHFMLDFLDALFEANRADITLIVDEADRFSPQRMSPEVARLHERMEEIVRRGRVRGFTPWLITQRPASLNKDVLSQATAYICMKMTGAHDRGAIADVIEGQADKATAKAIVDAMPKHKTGSGLVWSPVQDILLPVHFPVIKTFDSMRPLSATEKHVTETLPAIDVGALKEKLSTVETEAMANDPATLKKRIAELEKQLRAAPASTPILPDKKVLEAEYQRGAADGYKAAIERMAGRTGDARSRLHHLAGEMEALERAMAEPFDIPKKFAAPAIGPLAAAAKIDGRTTVAAHKALTEVAAHINGAVLPPSLQKVVNAIGWWHQIGHKPVRKERACVVAGYSPRASTFGVYLADLAKRGYIVSGQGTVELTGLGASAAVVPAGDTRDELRSVARSLLSPQEQKVFDVVYEAYPEEIRRDEVAERVGLSPTASTAGVYISGVVAYGIIEAASRGHVKAADWLFP